MQLDSIPVQPTQPQPPEVPPLHPQPSKSLSSRAGRAAAGLRRFLPTGLEQKAASDTPGRKAPYSCNDHRLGEISRRRLVASVASEAVASEAVASEEALGGGPLMTRAGR